VAPLELEDIQGNILRGYGFASAIYLFFEVPNAGSGRAFLGELVDGLQNAALWDEPPATATNVAITYAGLEALGVAGAVRNELPPAFCQPIRERAAQLLDDTGPSAPEYWVDGLGTERSHILVTVQGRKGCDEAFASEVRKLRGCAESHGLALVHDQSAGELENRREHFGWADGFGQPGVEGAPARPGKPSSRPGDGVPGRKDQWRDLKAGEFVHGYPDEDGQEVSGRSAALLTNGTYMVYRKLYQNVAAFRRQLQADALKYGRTLPDDPPLDARQLYELMAAKVVGRWRDGKSIMEAQRRSDGNSRELGDEALDEPDNNFRYRGDPSGFTCPLGAHIRRTNPRDALGWEGDGRMSVRHRIIRRGMPYGPFLPLREGEEDHGLTDDGEDRGLIFICFNASLDRQFELIQRQWCNDGNVFRLGNDKDYLLGDPTWAPPDTSGSPPIPLPDGRLHIPGHHPGRPAPLRPGASAGRAHPRLRVPADARPDGTAGTGERKMGSPRRSHAPRRAGGDRPDRVGDEGQVRAGKAGRRAPCPSRPARQATWVRAGRVRRGRGRGRGTPARRLPSTRHLSGVDTILIQRLHPATGLQARRPRHGDQGDGRRRGQDPGVGA